jgi:Rrf2 family protein
MLRPSKKMLFAIEAVLDIAYHSGGQPVRSSEITERQGIPRRYLEQTLQHLVRSNILVGVRGPHGGYRLARERRRISVAEIVRVVQAFESQDAPPEDMLASDIGKQVVQPLWNELDEEIIRRLETVTIDDLCTRAYKSGIVSGTAQAMDFSI